MAQNKMPSRADHRGGPSDKSMECPACGERVEFDTHGITGRLVVRSLSGHLHRHQEQCLRGESPAPEVPAEPKQYSPNVKRDPLNFDRATVISILEADLPAKTLAKRHGCSDTLIYSIWGGKACVLPDYDYAGERERRKKRTRARVDLQMGDFRSREAA